MTSLNHTEARRSYIENDCEPVIVVERAGAGRFKPKYLGASYAISVLAAINGPFVAVRLDAAHGKVTAATEGIAACIETSATKNGGFLDESV